MIRTAGAADAAALAGIQHRAWWRAYADFVDPERFGTLEERVERWHGLLADCAVADPAARARTTVVWDQDAVVAGFASVGPARDADVRGEAGELMAVYVDPAAQGAGVGRALMAAAEQRLRAAGFGSAVLWVFAANGLARDFYERRGWTLEPAGVIQAQHGSEWWAPAVRYRLAL